MQEIIEQLKNILAEVFKEAERHLKYEQMNLKEFDKILDRCEIKDQLNDLLKIRETIVRYKRDTSFWEKDVPNLITLLETSKERFQNYRSDLTEIGGKNSPNEDIINLIRQGIFNTETPISKTHKNEEFIGHLTTDGYLELEVSGVSKKLSLRRAALFAWGSNPKNQWTFWEAPDINGEKKPLEHFRKLLKSNT